MSRSYRKNHIFKDNGKGKKKDKNLANRKVRNYSDYIAKGNSYRKIYESWNITDGKWYSSLRDFLTWGWVKDDERGLEYLVDHEWKPKYHFK